MTVVCFRCIKESPSSNVNCECVNALLKEERKKMFGDILVMLAGLKVCTPVEGFTSMDQVRWHIEVALKDRAKVAQ